jgi:uncharacterized membrane protein
MFNLLTALEETIRHPERLHAVVVHFPVSISILGVLALLAFSCTAGKSSCMRWMCFGIYLIGAITAYGAVVSGGDAASVIVFENPIEGLFEVNDHGSMAADIWIGMSIVALLTVLTVARYAPFRILFLVLSLSVSIYVAGWTSLAAHHGGRIVFVHGGRSPPPQIPTNIDVSAE